MKMWYNIAKRIAVVAVIFALIISVLLIVNYIQTKSIDPLNSKAITQLMEKLREKSLQEYNFTMAKQERRFLDEIVTQKFQFKGKNK